MRRIAMVLGLAMVLALLAAGVAVAADRFNEINCENRDLPCNGTNDRDLMHERQGTVKDVINGKDGKDVLDANNFNFDRDRLSGGGSADKILANDGDGRDVAKGGAGRDICYVDPGDRTVNCNIVRRDDGRSAAFIGNDF
jgi:Ca2+-binding RTX toxin-like protein